MKQIEFTSRGKKIFGFAHVPESVKNEFEICNP